MNTDLAKERSKATIRVDSLREFFGKMLLLSSSGHARMQRLRKTKISSFHFNLINQQT